MPLFPHRIVKCQETNNVQADSKKERCRMNFLECLRECICTQCPNSLLLLGLHKDEPRFIESQKRGQMAHKRDKPGKSCCKCVLQKTMKGTDKAIVAKSFGKWKSGSLRSSTMEKPDEPSEESQEEDPQLGTIPVGKSRLPYSTSGPSVFLLFLYVAILIITTTT